MTLLLIFGYVFSLVFSLLIISGIEMDESLIGMLIVMCPIVNTALCVFFLFKNRKELFNAITNSVKEDINKLKDFTNE